MATEKQKTDYTLDQLLKKPIDFKYNSTIPKEWFGVDTFRKYGKTVVQHNKKTIFQSRGLYFILDKQIINAVVLTKYDKLEICRENVGLVSKFKDKNIIIINADDPMKYLRYYDLSISFECLDQYKQKDREWTIQNFNKLYEILDYTEDDEKDLTEKEIKLYDLGKYIPPLGYTVLNDYYIHRSATILLRNKKNDEHLLMGQDEGTYFLCLLKGKPKTIDAAYKDLTPKVALGKSYKRQGEWFFVHCEEPKNCLILTSATDTYEIFGLPIDDPLSNLHTVVADRFAIKDNILYLYNWKVHHDQHTDISSSGWCSVHKNTALKSFSQEGVD